jgi:predicted nucleic acid-binding protein
LGILHHDVGVMMTRTQLPFERDMLRQARTRASQLGIPLAEYARRLVAEDLGEITPSADSADTSNARAWEILSEGDSLVTTDHGLVEPWTLLHWRIHRKVAEAFWRGLGSGVPPVEVVTPADIQAAWTTGRDFTDQDFSLVDRTSFAVMERLGLERAASFDDDFAAYRWGFGRRRALEFLRQAQADSRPTHALTAHHEREARGIV